MTIFQKKNPKIIEFDGMSIGVVNKMIWWEEFRGGFFLFLGNWSYIRSHELMYVFVYSISVSFWTTFHKQNKRCQEWATQIKHLNCALMQTLFVSFTSCVLFYHHLNLSYRLSRNQPGYWMHISLFYKRKSRVYRKQKWC